MGKLTCIPNETRAKLDLWMPPGVSVKQVHYAIRALLDRKGFSDLQVVLESGCPAARTVECAG
jgi:hypothetical protein